LELSRVEIVLVRPRRPANVAAACRAMKNMGLRGLRLVEPPSGLGDPEARALAYGAWDVLDGAIPATTLGEAVSASVAVVGTTGREVAGAWTPRRLAAEAAALAGGGTLGIVFGPEATGLTGAELERCHALVHVPTDPVHPSLNLAQAVLVVAYELRLEALARDAAPPPAVATERAAAGEVEAAILELRRALLEIGYLDAANPDHILAELRRLAARARPSPREVVLLRGLARQIAWAGRVARSGTGAG
jgi:TrmH family RNA methyltransferase